MRKPITKAAVLLMLSSTSLSAQRPAVYDFGAVQSYSPWLTCGNRAGLYILPLSKVGNVQTAVQKSDGGYRDLHESSDAIEGLAETKAYSRVSERVTFYGDMGYSWFQGRNMGGPVLMDPASAPLNFYEYPDGNPGVKTRELYTLDGGMSYRVSESFSLGMSARYEAGNYSKRKDPRNLNRWMDTGVSLGVLNRFSDVFAVGADVRYRRTVESLSSRIYGVTGQNYFYFVDYGASLGKVEVLGSDNYFVASSSERPVLNNYLGCALQVEFGKPEGIFSFFNELAYNRRDGSYGDKASSEILFSHNNGDGLSYLGVVTLRGQSEHHIRLGVDYTAGDNYLNSFSVLSNPGENLEVEYYGDMKVQARATVAGKLGYDVLIGGSRLFPAWHIGASAGFSRDEMEVCYYPYTRDQKADIAFALLTVSHAMTCGTNVFEISADASFRTGGGEKASDSVIAEVYGPSPRSADAYLDASWEYRTASAASASLSFTYSRFIRKGLSLFAGVKEEFGSLVRKPEYLDGRFRNTATVTAGCRF